MSGERKNGARQAAPVSDEDVLDVLLTEFPLTVEDIGDTSETHADPDEEAASPRYVLSSAVARAPISLPLQLLVYGCPGSGKSYHLNEVCAAEVSHTITVVFHPEMAYADFVGVYRPCPVYAPKGDTRYTDESGRVREHGEPFITYEFVPGPLLDAYCFAKSNPDATVALIIEEISRANAALVFGDILQLLDRSDGGGPIPLGESVFAIQPRPEIASYLLKHGCAKHDDTRLRFPANLYIWATMNRADQNARQLDAAFLRRWRKCYLSYAASCAYGATAVELPGGGTTTWDILRAKINGRLESVVPEDKLVGPYFLTKSCLASKESVADDLLGYLWADVLKGRTTELFRHATFAAVRDAWVYGTENPFNGLTLE